MLKSSTNSLFRKKSSRRRYFMLDALALDDLAWSAAGPLAAAVASGRLTALEVVEATLARIRNRDPLLNCFTAVTDQRAIDRAHALDEARASGKPLGPLAGVPFAVKNLFDIAGLPTIAGSKINREKEPARRDAALVAPVVNGISVVGVELNICLHVFGVTGENLRHGNSRDSYDFKRMT